MPFGFERLNERSQRPNAHINFIRTLPGSTSAIAERILNRVAAICYPFMKSNMIFVQALEEFPYNTEFVGRNFNAGEVIQLVLRDRKGRWLSQRMVEMVMVHELAHCKQMNHSKAFWKVRDEYAHDLRGLWAKGYTGEGLWGRGRELDTGSLQMSEGVVGDVPEHLCGGTYGRRSRKRKRASKDKPALSYAERKQRRILKKFGAGGQALGADESTKVKLEGGMPKKAKPRVAGSARGRELRAAAALARFAPIKSEEVPIKEEEDVSDSETDDDISEEGAAVDVDGTKMLDGHGRALVKICEDEDDQSGNAQREFDEIQSMTPHEGVGQFMRQSQPLSPLEDGEKKGIGVTSSHQKGSIRLSSSEASHLNVDRKQRPFDMVKSRDQKVAKPTECVICSLENDAASLTCAACLNVMKPEFSPGHWQCRSTTCEKSNYINSGDVGSCGVCGVLRSSVVG